MRLKSLFYPFIILSLLLVSCEFKCQVGDSASREGDEQNKPVKQDGALIYNAIQVRTNKVELDKAYLVTDDNSGQRIPADNIVEIDKGVKLMLLIKDGWKEIDNRVWVGASLKVVADNGEVLLENADLFKDYEADGVTAKDAKALSLSVYFTTWNATRPVTLNVTFRVWDKRSDATIDGSYIVHTK